MALDYTTAETGIFVHLGKYAWAFNDLLSIADTLLPEARDDIKGSFAANAALRAVLGDIDQTFNGFQQAVVGWRSGMASLVETRLLDRVTVLEELDTDATLQLVLTELIRRMNDDSASVNASVVTLGSPTADGGNEGSGTALVSKVLDGYSSPGLLSGGTSAPSHIEYNGLDSQLACSETMTLTCVADSQTDGRTEGEEQFQWSGGVADQQFGFFTEGSGTGPVISTLNASSIIANRNFEDFTSNAPDSWTIDTGTAGTHILQQTAGANVFRGSKSLKFTGNGALAAIQISQTPTQSQLQPRRRYCLSVWVKADATIAAGDLTIQFEGTGYSAASSEKVEIAAANLPTSWTNYSFFINLPDILPSDFELVIKWTGTPTNAKSVWIDDLAFGTVDWHGGVNAVVLAGATRFVRGDRISFTVANDGGGVHQEFARQVLGVQWPSETDGSETIADALAE